MALVLIPTSAPTCPWVRSHRSDRVRHAAQGPYTRTPHPGLRETLATDHVRSPGVVPEKPRAHTSAKTDVGVSTGENLLLGISP